MSNVTKKTFCRICEAFCGLEVEVSDADEIVSIKPDADHPVSKGYACIKGVSLTGIHDDPKRVNYPLKRVDGKLKRISWDQAIKEIGDKTAALQKHHGDRCVASYNGNPTYFSFANTFFVSEFVTALGSPNVFCSHSIDCNNKMEASTHLFGMSTIHGVVDFENVDFFMCFGANPMTSQMSFASVINPVAKFKDIESRGGKVVFVDPRKTETADKVGEQIFIKPSTDVFMLLAMLHVIAHENTLDVSVLADTVDGVDDFIAVAKDWTPERVAVATGVDAQRIRELSLQFSAADGAALYMSTGVNMGPFGTVAYWLLMGLNLITGNLDQKGGVLFPMGPFDVLKLGNDLGVGGFNADRTLKNAWHKVTGNFPAAALTEEIEIDHPERIRALFVSTGNPVHSIPDGDKLSKAMEKLDLVVSIDIYQNDTSEYADYILPATDMLERSDYPTSHMLLQDVPHAQYTEPMVAPKYERRPEWQIYCDIAMAAGAKKSKTNMVSVLGHRNRLFAKIPFVSDYLITPDLILDSLLKSGRQVRLKQLKKAPSGLPLKPNEANALLGKRIFTDNGKVQLYPEKLVNDMPRLLQAFELYKNNSDKLQLIGRRDRRTHNSWMQKNTLIKKPDGNYAMLNSADAKSRGIEHGDDVEVFTELGRVTLPALISDEVVEGVVCVPHGWGHANPNSVIERTLSGENINSIIPGGHEHMEPISGQAIMTGMFVQVSKAA